MSNKVREPLEIAQTVLDLLKTIDVDHYTAATGVALAHKVLEYQQTKLIYEVQEQPV